MPDTAKQYFTYSVDGQMFQTELRSISIALLRAKLPSEKRAHAIFVEGEGNKPDDWMSDDKVINLEVAPAVKRFHTAPPAMFG